MKNLKLLFSLVMFLLMFNACKISEEPNFEKVKNIKVVSLNLNDVVIDCDALFHNPNDLGVELVDTDLDIQINGVNTGKIKQTSNSLILAHEQFTIPLRITFNPKDVFKNEKGGIVGAAISSFTDKKLNLVYLGKVRLKKAGIEFDVPVDYKTEIPLKKEK